MGDRTVLLAPGKEMVAVLQEVLARGNRVRMHVRGWSMRPWLQDGDIVWIEPAGPGDIRPGDVVLYRTDDGRPLVHRVRRRAGRGENARFYIQGDSDSALGEWVRTAQVLGRVVRVERNGRRVPLLRLFPRLRIGSFLARRTPQPLVYLLHALLGLLGRS